MTSDKTLKDGELTKILRKEKKISKFIRSEEDKQHTVSVTNGTLVSHQDYTQEQGKSKTQ